MYITFYYGYVLPRVFPPCIDEEAWLVLGENTSQARNVDTNGADCLQRAIQVYQCKLKTL